MFQKINAKNLGYIENDSFGIAYLNCDIEMPKECPRCKRAVVPQILDSYMLKYPEEEIAELTTMFFCRGCEKVFWEIILATMKSIKATIEWNYSICRHIQRQLLHFLKKYIN